MVALIKTSILQIVVGWIIHAIMSVMESKIMESRCTFTALYLLQDQETWKYLKANWCPWSWESIFGNPVNATIMNFITGSQAFSTGSFCKILRRIQKASIGNVAEWITLWNTIFRLDSFISQFFLILFLFAFYSFLFNIFSYFAINFLISLFNDGNVPFSTDALEPELFIFFSNSVHFTILTQKRFSSAPSVLLQRCKHCLHFKHPPHGRLLRRALPSFGRQIVLSARFSCTQNWHWRLAVTSAIFLS